MAEPDSRRLFFALWPEPDDLERLRAGTAGVDRAAGRATPSADLHVTLCFLGAVPPAVLPSLCARAAQLTAGAFELEFDALEYWRRARVLALTAAHPPASALTLAQALHAQARALSLTPPERELRPHVTLARGVSLAAGAAPPTRAFEPPLHVTARRLYLAQSHELEAPTAGSATAPRYARLASWPLLERRG